MKRVGALAFIWRHAEASGSRVYLSAVMVSVSVSLQYLSPTSLSIFLNAWSSRFKLDNFTCDSKDVIRLPGDGVYVLFFFST